MSARLARIVAAPWFTTVVLVVILANAVALGLETYDGIEDRFGETLDLVNDVCLGIFVIELAIRIGAYGRRPLEFFRSGWNVFDFVVIAIAFVPGVRESSTLLRLARLARVVRIVRLFPDLRVLLAGVWRSIPPLFAIGLATAMLLFVYGMVGWSLFHDELPEDWGNIGRAMLTLFVMLTLENFPVYMDAGMEVHPWSWVYFVSFILIAAFVVINVLIGIVLNSMEEAREEERRRAVRERLGADRPSAVDPDASAPVVERIGILRAALDELEAELSVGRPRGSGAETASDGVAERHEYDAALMSARPPRGRRGRRLSSATSSASSRPLRASLPRRLPRVRRGGAGAARGALDRGRPRRARPRRYFALGGRRAQLLVDARRLHSHAKRALLVDWG